MLERVRQLIAADKLEQAIQHLIAVGGSKNEDVANELTAHLATLDKNKKDGRRGLITTEEENKTRTRVRYAVLERLQEIEEVAGSASQQAAGASGNATTDARPSSTLVFISYNHSDSEIADKLKTALERNGIEVRIDRAAMEAGASIQEFIESSIRDTDATISIVSNRSLLSSWVTMETIHTLYHEKFKSDKKFIACYVDDDFFRTDFRLTATRRIDAQIDEIDRQIPEYLALKIDTNDLNNQKSRLHKLRSSLGDILLRLRESLCLDIREDKFDESMAKILRALRGSPL